jgi:transposase
LQVADCPGGTRGADGPQIGASFERRIKELVAGHATLVAITTALLSVHGVLAREFRTFEKRVRAAARADTRVRLLTSAPGVGPIVGLTYVCAIDDPSRFKSSRMVGVYFGLTPKKYQSGKSDVTGRISKIGDGAVRTALFEAGYIILTRPVKGSSLKSWAASLPSGLG